MTMMFEKNALKILASYTFEGGGNVQIIIGGKVETDDVLWALDLMIALKRKEINERKAADVPR